MIGYVIAFIAGGYLIPASMHSQMIWAAERDAEDGPTWFERFMTATVGALTWPVAAVRAEPVD